MSLKSTRMLPSWRDSSRNGSSCLPSRLYHYIYRMIWVLMDSTSFLGRPTWSDLSSFTTHWDKQVRSPCSQPHSTNWLVDLTQSVPIINTLTLLVSLLFGQFVMGEKIGSTRKQASSSRSPHSLCRQSTRNTLYVYRHYNNKLLVINLITIS